jgi:UDP-glucose:(heptosyl)LPS alpha-1,3-glucosyltransferase
MKLRADTRKRFLRNAEELLLLAVGADARRKGLDRTIYSLAALPANLRNKTRLVVVGDHRTKPFERLASTLCVSDRISFLPPLPDIACFFHGADLLVHPAYSEAGGAVLLESMAYGLPVLATDVCGYADYVQKAHAGVILPFPFDQEYMNRSLSSLLNPRQLQTLAENARAYVLSTPLHRRSEHIVTIIETRVERNRHHVPSA